MPSLCRGKDEGLGALSMPSPCAPGTGMWCPAEQWLHCCQVLCSASEPLRGGRPGSEAPGVLPQAEGESGGLVPILMHSRGHGVRLSLQGSPSLHLNIPSPRPGHEAALSGENIEGERMDGGQPAGGEEQSTETPQQESTVAHPSVAVVAFYWSQ